VVELNPTKNYMISKIEFHIQMNLIDKRKVVFLTTSIANEKL